MEYRPSLKTCRRCGSTQPITDFPKHKQCKGGYTSTCKACYRADGKIYREQHKEEIQRKKSEYYRKNHPIIIRTHKRCSKCGEEKPATPEYFYQNANNPQCLTSWCKACYSNRESWPNKPHNQKKYRTRHRDDIRAYFHRNRKAARESAVHFSAQDVKNKFAEQHGRCYWCGTLLTDNYQVDHVIPLAVSGDNSPDNIVISCAFCNNSKHNKMPNQFKARLTHA